MTKKMMKELARYDKANSEAVSMLPSGIVASAMDEIGNLFGWDPQPGEIRAASTQIEEAIVEAYEAQDYNRNMDNVWDPRCAA